MARRWLDRGNDIGDSAARFLFYFTGFNALFYPWMVVDEVEGHDGKKIRNLVLRLDVKVAENLLDQLQEHVAFFAGRRPVERMDRRKSDPCRGKADEGRRHQRDLMGDGAPPERLCALAQILYQVRSNLIHGSKAAMGDDSEIIENCILPMRLILEATLSMSESGRPS